MGGREGHLLNARVLANLKLVPSQPSCHSKEERAQGEGKGPPPPWQGSRISAAQALLCPEPETRLFHGSSWARTVPAGLALTRRCRWAQLQGTGVSPC